MEVDAFKTNLETVKELILDEHKLVTYISLSKDLCIHVNEAKSLISRVIQDIRRAQPEIDLCVSYVISGLLNNDSGCTTVCSETDIDTLKKSLKIVFYEHVYGVSRGLNSVDKVALSAVNKFEDLSLCIGLISTNSCTKRTSSEIGNLKSIKSHTIITAPKSMCVQQNPKVKEITKNEHGDKNKNIEVKLEPNVKFDNPSPKRLSKNKTPTKPNGNKQSSKGIAGFFSKINGDSSKIKKTLNLCQQPKVKEEKVQLESINSTISTKAVKNASLKNESDKSSSNSLTLIKKNAKVDSKRKRLLHVSDSESETEENNPFTNEMDIDHVSEDEIPPTPTISTVKITSGIVNPKKRRKIVDKTYTDEDGYILTKKEEVYESCSDNEEEAKENVKLEKDNYKQEIDIHAKENIKETKDNSERTKQISVSPKENKTKKKKVSPPQKGKQSTINNFFKKV